MGEALIAYGAAFQILRSPVAKATLLAQINNSATAVNLRDAICAAIVLFGSEGNSHSTSHEEPTAAPSTF